MSKFYGPLFVGFVVACALTVVMTAPICRPEHTRVIVPVASHKVEIVKTRLHDFAKMPKNDGGNR